MPIPRECSTDELTLVLGLTKQAIGKLVDRGVLQCTGRGRFDLPAAVKAYLKYREQLIAKRFGGAGSYTESRARKMSADAARSEDELKKSRGELIPIDDLRKALQVMGHLTQTLFLASPSRMAPRLARAATIAECFELLMRENRAILQRIGDSSFKQVKTERGTYTVKYDSPSIEDSDRKANPRYFKSKPKGSDDDEIEAA
jgi:hypothetical protein